METFEEHRTPVRCYSKRELARLYFPGSSAKVGCSRLKRWITHCPALQETLASLRLSPSQGFWRPREVQCIFEYLGEP